MANFELIPYDSVTCEDGSRDIFVYSNPNPLGGGNVEAFIQRFQPYARSVEAMNNMPIGVTLTIWGGESLWGASRHSVNNQNWANMVWFSDNSPYGNIGIGISPNDLDFAAFEGAQHHATAFYHLFRTKEEYKNLRTELSKSKPDYRKCFEYIAEGGYNGNKQSQIESWRREMIGYYENTYLDALSRL